MEAEESVRREPIFSCKVIQISIAADCGEVATRRWSSRSNKMKSDVYREKEADFISLSLDTTITLILESNDTSNAAKKTVSLFLV